MHKGRGLLQLLSLVLVAMTLKTREPPGVRVAQKIRCPVYFPRARCMTDGPAIQSHNDVVRQVFLAPSSQLGRLR